MILLQRPHLHLAALDGLDGFEGHVGSAEGGHNRDAVLHRGGADFDFILTRVLSGRRVDDEGHVLVLHQVDDVGALAAGEFGEDVDGDAGVADDLAGAGGGVEGEAEVGVERWCAGDFGAVQCQRDGAHAVALVRFRAGGFVLRAWRSGTAHSK
jgi:hypothetical protein